MKCRLLLIAAIAASAFSIASIKADDAALNLSLKLIDAPPVYADGSIDSLEIDLWNMWFAENYGNLSTTYSFYYPPERFGDNYWPFRGNHQNIWQPGKTPSMYQYVNIVITRPETDPRSSVTIVLKSSPVLNANFSAWKTEATITQLTNPGSAPILVPIFNPLPNMFFVAISSP